jgi:hypothetical protein
MVQLTLRELSAVAVALIIVIGTIWYIYQVITNKNLKPVLTSWIVFSSTTALSLATYMTSPNHSLVSNSCNFVGMFSTLGTLIAVLWRQGFSVEFTSFQKKCLWAAAGITAYWIVLVWGLQKTGFVPNILLQVLMVIGYFATIQKLWSAPRNTEPLFTWWCISLGSAVALYTSFVSHDLLAAIFAIRGTIAAGTIVWLMYRAQRRAEKVKITLES